MSSDSSFKISLHHYGVLLHLASSSSSQPLSHVAVLAYRSIATDITTNTARVKHCASQFDGARVRAVVFRTRKRFMEIPHKLGLFIFFKYTNNVMQFTHEP
jgi:uncharacterized protein (DUF2126 family)